MIWLLLGNLTVGAGILHFIDVPHDPQEIAAVRASGTRFTGMLNGGWYGTEQTFRHRWSWSSGRGLITFESWPRQSMPVAITCQLRSSKPCIMTISSQDKILWQNKVGPGLVPAEFSLTLVQGRAQVELLSDQTPIEESKNPDSRNLAFALYDVKISPLAPAR